MQTRKQSAIFMLGGALYSILELLWRGYTHWTMSVTGGLCLTFLNKVYCKMKNPSVIKKCLCGSIIISACEFVAGIIINKIFKLDVWDYSKKSFNIAGQICPFYAMLWFFLCIPISYFCNLIEKKA